MTEPQQKYLHRAKKIAILVTATLFQIACNEKGTATKSVCKKQLQ